MMAIVSSLLCGFLCRYATEVSHVLSNDMPYSVALLVREARRTHDLAAVNIDIVPR